MPKIDYLKESNVVDSMRLCPHCQSILKGLTGINNNWYFYYCENPDCNLVAMPNNPQVKTIMENARLLAAYPQP